MGSSGLFIVNFLLLISLSNSDDCCHRKVVTKPDKFAGIYNFVKKFDGPKDDNCADSCIYSKDGDQFCFKAVVSGAATIQDQCDTDTTFGATSFEGTITASTGTTKVESTLNPVSQIQTSIKKIEDANKEIVEENAKSEAAFSASTAVKDIDSALGGGSFSRSMSDKTRHTFRDPKTN